MVKGLVFCCLFSLLYIQNCKDLDLQRGNFNRYCRDDFQRVDANLIIKLCDYFNCNIEDLLEIKEEK